MPDVDGSQSGGVGWFVGELEDVLLVAFAGDAGCPPFELQRAVVPDPQDRALGHDVHCLSVEGRTTYGAVARWQLDAQRLTLDLTDEAASALGPRVVRAAVDDRTAAQLVDVLPRMFGPQPP